MDHIPLEKPLAELELKIDELRRLASTRVINLNEEIQELEDRSNQLLGEMFARLTPYEKVQLSRHPRRPNSLELIRTMTSDFVELHGDRNFCDDPAIVGGVARMGDRAIVIVGHQKGRGTRDNIYRNFGMPRPEGYRKALRLMSMAERFHIPIVTLVDTPGAYPGVGAEERGQSEAIAKNIMVMSRLRVPIITFVTGEGGSGGALALAVANRVNMLEHSIYSVISPEGCASILMKSAADAPRAADALKLTAQFAKSLGVIDTIIAEPRGGAHRSIDQTAESIRKQIFADLAELDKLSPAQLRQERYEKFAAMGEVLDKNQI